MSIAIFVKQVKPSELMKAACAAFSLNIKQWETLDYLPLGTDKNRPYHNLERDYVSAEVRHAELTRALLLIEGTKGMAEKKACTFLVHERDAAARQMLSYRLQTIPYDLKNFLSDKLKATGYISGMVPGGMVEIVSASGVFVQLYESLHPKGMQALRNAKPKMGEEFLRQLPASAPCRIEREDTHELIADWCKPEAAMKLLRSKPGRGIAHRKLPLFDEKGNIVRP